MSGFILTDDYSTLTQIRGALSYPAFGRLVPWGAWTDVPFAATDFTGYTTMTWTVAAGNVVTFAFTERHNTMTVAFWIRQTTVAGTPTTALQIRIPNERTAGASVINPCVLSDNGTTASGYVQVTTGSTRLQVLRLDNANFAAATAATLVAGEITFPLLRSV